MSCVGPSRTVAHPPAEAPAPAAIGTDAMPLRVVLAALLVGSLFGLGLAWAGMINPLKVLAFLDLAGAWDGSLVFVLGAAVLLSALGYRIVLRRARPLLEDRFQVPSGDRIDAPLLLGAALFGVGWGIAGYCPGPAISSLAYLNPEALWFVPSLLVGAGLRRVLARRAEPDVERTA